VAVPCDFSIILLTSKSFVLILTVSSFSLSEHVCNDTGIGALLRTLLGMITLTIGTLDVLQACDACADMGMTYSVIVQCTDCVVFPTSISNL